jgi:hypothetical protein
MAVDTDRHQREVSASASPIRVRSALPPHPFLNLSLGERPPAGRQHGENVHDKTARIGIIVAEGVAEDGRREFRKVGAVNSPLEAPISKGLDVSLAVIDLDVADSALI